MTPYSLRLVGNAATALPLSTLVDPHLDRRAVRRSPGYARPTRPGGRRPATAGQGRPDDRAGHARSAAARGRGRNGRPDAPTTAPTTPTAAGGRP